MATIPKQVARNLIAQGREIISEGVPPTKPVRKQLDALWVLFRATEKNTLETLDSGIPAKAPRNNNFEV